MKSILVKFGKADPDGASPEVKQRYLVCEDNRAHMKKVQEKFHAFLKKNNTAIEEGREFAEAVQQYGDSLTREAASGESTLAASLLQASALHRFIEDVRSDVHGFLLKHVDQPIESAMQEEGETSQGIKKRYDKARVSFENLRRGKGSELQAEESSDVIGDTSQQYIRLEEITEETIEALQLHQQQGDIRALAFACKYVEVVHTTVAVLHNKAAELLPTLERNLAHLSREVEAFEIKAGRPFPQLFPEFSPTWSQASLPLVNHSGNSEDEVRKRDIADLLKRERGYVNTLKSLTKIYLFEFRNNRSVTKSVSLQDLQDLFCNIEDIFEVHQDFAWELQAALDSSPAVSVGVLLVNFIPKLEVYLKYISNLKKSTDTLRRLRSKSKAVLAAIRQCEEKDRSGLDFVSLLHLPAKHVTKYNDLVANIFVRTPTSSSDYDHVDQAVVLVSDLNTRIEQAEEASTAYQLTEIAAASIEAGEELIAPPSSPLSPSRLIVSQVPASMQTGDDVTPITLYLFSDQLIVCDGSRGESEVLKRRKTISLSSVVQVSEATSISTPNALVLELLKEQPLLLVFPSALERSQWHREISETLRTHQYSRAFGLPMEDLMTLNKKEKGLDVPSFIVAALDTIDTHGLEVEGIFRVSGSVLVIRTAKEALNQGFSVDYSNYDIHSVAGVVQAWLRELPEPLMTYKLYPEWVDAIRSTDAAENIHSLKSVVTKLPMYNRFMLHHLCRFLNRVAYFGKVNKMKSGNLAIVLGPSILAQRDTNMIDSPLQDIYAVVQCLIDNQKDIFEGIDAEREAFRARIQQDKEALRDSELEERKRKRAEVKRRRTEDERRKAEIEQASDISLIREAETRRAKQREEREKKKQEAREAEELRKRLEQEVEEKRLIEEKVAAEHKAQLEALEKQKQEVEQIEKRFREEQERLEREEQALLENRRREKLEFEENERQKQLLRDMLLREQLLQEQELRRLAQEEMERQVKMEQEAAEKRRLETKQKAIEALPKCASCKNLIDGDGVSSGDTSWHKSCFVCTNCRNEIRGPFAVKEGHPICGDCHNKRNQNECSVCRKELTGRVVRIGDNRFHKACFKCAVCGLGLEDGYYEKDGKFVCEEHM